MKFLITSLAPLVLVITLVLVSVNKLSSYACEATWADSGFAIKYSFLAGCRIQTLDGKWIPADNYREVK